MISLPPVGALRPFALGLLVFATSLHATTTAAGRVENLNKDLSYVRPAPDHADSLALLKPLSGPAVLDLRYFSSDKYSADWLAAIKAFATPTHVCFVLVSPETSSVILIGLTAGVPDCITLGRSSPALQVDIAIDTPAETDRRAWNAIVHDTALDQLITATLDKPRYDEAVLAKEHAAELTDADADSADTSKIPATDTPPKEPPAPAKPKPLIDAVLKRAVQIDCGLLALRKL